MSPLFPNFTSDASTRNSIDEMPHRFPFLFIDEAQVLNDSVHAVYKIKGDENFLKGHFKDNPVFPASIMIEALGQLGVLFLVASQSNQIIEPVDPNSIYFTSCDGIKCFRVCKPGDTLQLTVHLKRIRKPLAVFEGKISVNDVKTAKAESITLLFDSKH